MKNIFILLITLLSISNTLNAQLRLDVRGSGFIENRLGVGTSSPATKLHIVHDGSINNVVRIESSSVVDNQDMLEIKIPDDASDNAQFIEMERGADVVAKIDSDGSADFRGSVKIATLPLFAAASLNFGEVSSIETALGSLQLFSKFDDANTGFISFSTNEGGDQKTRMHIDNDGSIGIGTINPAAKLDIRGNEDNNGTTALVRIGNGEQFLLLDGNEIDATFTDLALNNNVDIPIKMVNGGGTVSIGSSTTTSFKLQVFGSAAKTGGGSWSNPSDQRLKRNIQPYEDGLEKVLQIEPVEYEYNGKAGIKTTERQIGVIAQKMQKIAPYTVSTFKNIEENQKDAQEYLSFNGSAIRYMLVNAVKELNTKLETKETQNQQLETKVAALERKLETLIQLVTRVTDIESNLQSCCLQHHSGSHNAETGATEIFNQEYPQLQQNFPNPFNQQTEIQYYLPTTVQTAQIHITDLQGKTLKTYNLSEKGIGKVMLNGGQLAAGTYAYTLIIDGVVVDTKQMVLTK